MFHKVAAVRPSDDYRLIVDFCNGARRIIYDIKPLLDDFAMFRPLIDHEGLFESVRVDIGGYGIVWNDAIDLSCDELYTHGQPLPEEAVAAATAN